MRHVAERCIEPLRARYSFRRPFARLVQRLGIENLTFHDLCHDVSSQLAMASVPLRTIAEILGHRNLEMTLGYAHLSPGHLREAIAVLDSPPGVPSAARPTVTISSPG